MHQAEVARRIRLDLLEQATGVTVDREAGRAALLRRIATADGRPAHRRPRPERTWAAGLVAATLAAAACLTLVSLSRVPDHDAVPQQVSTPRSTDDRSGEEQSASLTGGRRGCRA